MPAQGDVAIHSEHMHSEERKSPGLRAASSEDSLHPHLVHHLEHMNAHSSEALLNTMAPLPHTHRHYSSIEGIVNALGGIADGKKNEEVAEKPQELDEEQ